MFEFLVVSAGIVITDDVKIFSISNSKLRGQYSGVANWQDTTEKNTRNQVRVPSEFLDSEMI
jgi:hypothetical protein